MSRMQMQAGIIVSEKNRLLMCPCCGDVISHHNIKDIVYGEMNYKQELHDHLLEKHNILNSKRRVDITLFYLEHGKEIKGYW